MVIDPTITVGNLVEIGTILIGGIIVIVKMGGDIRVIKNDVDHMQKEVGLHRRSIEKIGEVLTSVASQDSRLESLEFQLLEMRHGRGFVQQSIQDWPQPPKPKSIIKEQT